MKKIYLVFCFVVFAGLSANAQNNFKDAKKVRTEEGMNVPSFVLLEDDQTVSEASFFSYLQKETGMNVNYTFQLLSSTTDHLGIQHKRYRQFYSGTEVNYSNLMIHIKEGKVYSFNGVYQINSPTSSDHILSKEEALTKALDFVGAKQYQWEVEPGNPDFLPNGKLCYLPEYFGDQNTVRLMYKFNIYAAVPLSRQLIFVNAATGTIDFHESEIHTGGDTKGTAITGYSDTQEIVTDSIATNVFYLRDSTKGNGIFTLNCERKRNYTTAVEFVDSNNFWNNFNSNLDQYATDAHWATGETYNYLSVVHNRNSIDNNGFQLTSYVHYDQNYVNAFWNGSVMTYGDGNNLNGPLTTLDIVGHEITHGLTDFTSDLIYANESGALNESFSDIFGTALEFYSRPNRANWTVGEDIGGAFRSMSNPNANNDPDTYDGLYWINQNCFPTAGNDRCGVHTNSGVQNYWFYLLVNGGNGLNDNNDTFNVASLGMQKAEKIAFRNLTVYLSPSSTYADARFYSIISAIDLYGACSPEVEATTNAWHAVGVGGRYQNSVSADFTAIQDTAFCYFPVTLDFTSEASNVKDFYWDFGNGDTSSLRNVTATYTTQGIYDVQLIGDGGACGADTVLKTSYIVIDTNIACAFTLRDTINSINGACAGRLYDSGGFGGEYSNNEDATYTIQAGGADFITLDFIRLDLEDGTGWNCNRDYIEVYDGPTTDALFLGRFCGNSKPAGNRVVSSTNAVTIKFSSDEAAIKQGFQINWSCSSSTVLPIADFTANADSTCDGVISFTNRTTNGSNSYAWDFGDGSSSTEADPTHEYKSNGTYNVTMVATNSLGTNTVVKNGFVVNRPAAPSVSSDTVCIGENSGFKVFSSDRIEWHRDTNANFIFSGDSLTVNNLRRDTSFYVKSITEPQIFTGGKLSNAGAGGHANDNDYLIFDVHKRIVLKTMVLFSNRAGTRKLELWNNRGELVKSQDVYVSSSPLRVNINMEIDPDSNYRFAFNSRNISLYKNTSGATFPYSISNLVTLKGANTPGEYPYFYRWQVAELPCESNFTEIKTTVDSTCTIVGIEDAELSYENLQIQPNPFVNELKVQFNEQLQEELTLMVYSSTGVQVMKPRQIKIGENSFSLDLSNVSSGVYYLSIVGRENTITRKVIKIE